jgi:hypothetical protein
LGVIWADPHSVSKLLGTPFGLSLLSADVNTFLFDRISKKLSYWVTVHINPIGRGVIVNSVLNSSTFFFLSVWGGNSRGVKKVKSALLNYLASGKSHRARARVNWIQCCQRKEDGGLNIIYPEDAVVALMIKWVTKAMEPGRSNLHLMLRYRLGMYQPYKGGRWQPSLEYFTIPWHQSKHGSLPWNRVVLAWKSLISDVQFIPPTCLEELMCCSLWYYPTAPLIGPAFSKTRAAALHHAGMRLYRDIWENGNFLPPVEIQRRFGLLPGETSAWQATMRLIRRTWRELLRRNPPLTTPGEWYGFYASVADSTPFSVVKMCTKFAPRRIADVVTIEVPVDVPTYTVQYPSSILQESTYEQRCIGAHWDLRGEDMVSQIMGIMRRVRVVPVTRGP